MPNRSCSALAFADGSSRLNRAVDQLVAVRDEKRAAVRLLCQHRAAYNSRPEFWGRSLCGAREFGWRLRWRLVRRTFDRWGNAASNRGLMRGTVRCLSMLLLSVSLGGCANVSRPNWFAPGPPALQRARANRFDPYPENDLGPAVTGARPRDFQIPQAEPKRARWSPLSWIRTLGPGPEQAPPPLTYPVGPLPPQAGPSPSLPAQ